MQKTKTRKTDVQPEPQSKVPVSDAVRRRTFKPMKPRPYGSTKAVVAQAFEQLGGVPRVMDLLGTGQSQTYGFTDESEQSANLSLERARWLSRNCGISTFAEDMAKQAGGIFLPMRTSDSDQISRLIANVQEQSGGLGATLIRALEDGVITREERAELLKAVDVLVHTLASAQHTLIAADGD